MSALKLVKVVPLATPPGWYVTTWTPPGTVHTKEEPVYARKPGASVGTATVRIPATVTAPAAVIVASWLSDTQAVPVAPLFVRRTWPAVPSPCIATPALDDQILWAARHRQTTTVFERFPEAAVVQLVPSAPVTGSRSCSDDPPSTSTVSTFPPVSRTVTTSQPSGIVATTGSFAMTAAEFVTATSVREGGLMWLTVAPVFVALAGAAVVKSTTETPVAPKYDRSAPTPATPVPHV